MNLELFLLFSIFVLGIGVLLLFSEREKFKAKLFNLEKLILNSHSRANMIEDKLQHFEDMLNTSSDDLDTPIKGSKYMSKRGID